MKVYKPRFWDNKKFTIWPYFLLPFSIIVNLINFLKFKYYNKKKFNIPVILIGNIYLGGTGKTPLCIEIFRILKSLKKNPAFIQKYREEILDEQKLLKNTGEVFSNKRRSDAIKLLINSKFDVAILDDGFQDPSIKSDLSIVCFNEDRWIGNGFVIPSGPLREKLTALKRCDYVFINGEQNIAREELITEYNSKIKIFYTQYKPVNLDDIKNKRVLAFAGIESPKKFFDLLMKNDIKIVKTVKFPDHYNFTKKDISNLNNDAEELKANLVTTEKDYFRLNDKDRKNINFLKIELLLNNKDKFIEEIKKVI